MSIRAADFVQVAERLAAVDDEPHARSAVSRAYYGAYHAALAWERGLAAPGSMAGAVGGMHEQLLARLRTPAPEVKGEQRLKSRSLAYRLQVLRASRTMADYDLAAAVDPGEVGARVADARDLVESFANA